jgi:hypothetical protein
MLDTTPITVELITRLTAVDLSQALQDATAQTERVAVKRH